MLNDVLRRIDAMQGDVIHMQTELVKRPALGPDNASGPVETIGAEWDKARWIVDYCKGLGFTDLIEAHAPDPRVAAGSRPNFGLVVPGVDRSRTLWIYSHTDVVPPGDLALWESDPFTLRIEGDRLYGRGVEDDHQAVVSSLILLKALKESGAVPAMKLGLFFLADEESGSAYGMDYVLQAKPELFHRQDIHIIPDFGSADSTLIETAEKSLLWLRIIVEGKQCHASTPDEGINTLRAAAKCILDLGKLAKLFPQTDPLFSPPRSTFEPTKKEANVPNINTVPGRDVFYLDCRVLPDVDLGAVISAVEDIAMDVEYEHGVKISLEIVQKSQAAPKTDPEADVVRGLKAGIKAVYGVDARAKGIGGGTVAALLRRRGMPAAVWATCVHNAHQPNEFSLISTQLKDAQVFAHILFNNF